MIRWSRRRLLGGAAAVACVGCSGADSAGGDTERPPSTGMPLDELAGVTLPEGVPVPVIGAPVDVGPLDELREALRPGPMHVAEARVWLVGVEEAHRVALAQAFDGLLRPGIESGVLALFQKCPHLGCRVPFCESSGRFECPCHGSSYTSFGEHREGPGPRGLDAFAVIVDDGRVSIAVAELVRGLAAGSPVVVDLPVTGPACVSGVGD